MDEALVYNLYLFCTYALLRNMLSGPTEMINMKAFCVSMNGGLHAMTHGQTSVAIALIGILAFMGDLPCAAADSPIGPPRPRSIPNTQVTSPISNNAPTPGNAAPSLTPDAAVNQGKP